MERTLPVKQEGEEPNIVEHEKIESLLYKLDQILRGYHPEPGYDQSQLKIFSGENPIYPTNASFINALDNFAWWTSFMENQDAQEILERLLSAKYISLNINEDNREDVLGCIRELREQFLRFARFRSGDAAIRELSDGLFTTPQERIQEIKDDPTITGDEETTLIYDIKGEKTVDIPGYGSYHFGLTPVKTAELLGLTVEELKEEKILITGIGPGDFVRFSLPVGSNVEGLDIAPSMADYCKEKGIPCQVGNISDTETFDLESNPDVIIADYFLDIIEKPMEAIQNMSDLLKDGGRLLVTVLCPINQVGADSKMSGKTMSSPKVAPQQDIGNTGNPWLDMMVLKHACAQYGLKLTNFSVTSYCQYDTGRQEEKLPGEIRPSFILSFEKQ